MGRFILIDFGAAKQVQNNVFSYKRDLLGHTCTMGYCPFEMTQKERWDDKYDYTNPDYVNEVYQNEQNPFAVDVWGLGCIFLGLALQALMATDAKWVERYRSLQGLRKEFSEEFEKYQRSRLFKDERKRTDEYFAYIDKLSSEIFFNLNREDLSINFTTSTISKGINHLREMLQPNPANRITGITAVD